MLGENQCCRSDKSSRGQAPQAPAQRPAAAGQPASDAAQLAARAPARPARSRRSSARSHGGTAGCGPGPTPESRMQRDLPATAPWRWRRSKRPALPPQQEVTAMRRGARPAHPLIGAPCRAARLRRTARLRQETATDPSRTPDD